MDLKAQSLGGGKELGRRAELLHNAQGKEQRDEHRTGLWAARRKQAGGKGRGGRGRLGYCGRQPGEELSAG